MRGGSARRVRGGSARRVRGPVAELPRKGSAEVPWRVRGGFRERGSAEVPRKGSAEVPSRIRRSGSADLPRSVGMLVFSCRGGSVKLFYFHPPTSE